MKTSMINELIKAGRALFATSRPNRRTVRRAKFISRLPEGVRFRGKLTGKSGGTRIDRQIKRKRKIAEASRRLNRSRK
jgi:hypothetical protein